MWVHGQPLEPYENSANLSNSKVALALPLLIGMDDAFLSGLIMTIVQANLALRFLGATLDGSRMQFKVPSMGSLSDPGISVRIRT